LAVSEVLHRHPERAVGFKVDELVVNQVDVLRLAVGGKAHEFVLAGVHSEAGEIGERRVEEADRMRKTHLPEQLDPVAAPDAIARRCPLAHAIESENRGLVER
jgi:hypothetical protein